MEPKTMLAIAGTAMNAAGTISQGAAARNQASVQSEIYRRQAEREREIGKLNAQRIDKEGERLMARQRAMLASSGRDPGSGSALLLQEDLAESTEFEKRLAEAGGDTRATEAEQRATLASASGRAARRSSLFRAGTTLLKGASEIEFG